MKTKYLLFVVVLFFSLLYVIVSRGAQQNVEEKNPKKIYKQAQKYFDLGEYDETKKLYYELIGLDSNNFDYNYELGLMFFYSDNDKLSALPFIEVAARNSKGKDVGGLYYYLGKCYQFAGMPREALGAYEEFLKIVKNTKAGMDWIVEVNDEILKCINSKKTSSVDNGFVKVSNLGADINSVHPDYCPVLTHDENVLFFTTRRNVNKNDGIYYEDVYITEKNKNKFNKALNIKQDYYQFKQSKFVLKSLENILVNSKVHLSIIGINPQEDKLFLFKENKLWLSNYVSDIWEEPKAMEGSHNFGRYQPHGSMTEDGKTIYFSMTNNRRRNDLDIYITKKQGDGSWAKPENLGETINSTSNEDSPEISQDGKVLTFSSKGHNGYGGYDVYVSYLINDKWTEPVNLGEPVNSLGDDIFFKLNKKGDEALFSSNRYGGYGDMDIYSAFYNVSVFENAKKYKNIEHKIALNAKSLIADDIAIKKNEELVYEWDFGDGNIIKGEKTKYSYSKPGKYRVKLTVRSKKTNKIKFVKRNIKINIENVTYVNFECQDTININTETCFDASSTVVSNGTIKEYVWNFNDNTMDDSANVCHDFSKEGVYNVQMVVSYEDNLTFAIDRYMFEKKVVVLNNENYLAYSNKRKSEQNQLVTAENELIAENENIDKLHELEEVENEIEIIISADSSPKISSESQNVNFLVSYETQEFLEPKNKNNLAVTGTSTEANEVQIVENIPQPALTRLIPIEILQKRKEDSLLLANNSDEYSAEDKEYIDFDLINKYNDLYDKYLKDYFEKTDSSKNQMSLFEFKDIAYNLKMDVDSTIDQNNLAQFVHKTKFENSMPLFKVSKYKRIKDMDNIFRKDTSIIAENKVVETEKSTKVIEEKDIIAENKIVKTKKTPNKEIIDTKAKEVVVDIGSKLDTNAIADKSMPSYLPQFKFETAYFGFDKSEITKEAGDVLDENIKRLKQNPSYYIKLSAYTDAIGNKDYNMELSEKRARSVVKYLVKNGISKDRIMAMLSFGEKNLVNNCGDDKKCAKEMHRLNRRVEISVVNSVK